MTHGQSGRPGTLHPVRLEHGRRFAAPSRKTPTGSTKMFGWAETWRPSLLRALFILVLAVAGPGVAIAQTTGSAQGVVTNGTSGTPASGLAVTVQIFSRMEQIGQKTVTTDANGHFGVLGLPAGPDNRYIVSLMYAGVKYGPKEAISPNAPPSPSLLTVFEKTESTSAISILSASVAITSIDAASGLLQVLEVLTVDNRSNLTFVGELLTNPEKGGVLRIPLVGPGLDLEIGDGFGNDGVLATSRGMITRTPLFPGQTVLVFDYKAVYDQKTMTLSRSFVYPVARASFVIRVSGPKASSPQLLTSETVSIDSVSSIVLSGKGFAPGEPITVTLTGLPATGSVGSRGSYDTALRYGGVATVTLAFMALAVYILLNRNRRPAPVGLAEGSPRGLSEMESLGAQRRALVEAIAQLDREFEAGIIARQHYESSRGRLRQRLTDVALLVQERSTPGQ